MDIITIYDLAKDNYMCKPVFLPNLIKSQQVFFDGGQLVNKKEIVLEITFPSDEIEEEVNRNHVSVMSDLKLLFFVAEKVRVSKHTESIKKLGSLFFEKGFYDEAIDQFSLALEINPKTENSYYYLGLCYFKKAEYRTALEKFLLAAVQTPEYADLHFFLARTHWKLQHYKQSFTEFERAIELNESYDVAYYLFGLYLLKSVQHATKHPDLSPPILRIKKASKNLHIAAKLSSRYSKKYLMSGFENLEIRHQLNQAVEDFEKAYPETGQTILEPFVDNEFYLKYMFSDLQKDENTLEAYIKNLELSASRHPDYADIRRNLGIAYLLKAWQFFTKATEEFRHAVKINPGYDKAKKNLKLLESEIRGILLLLRAILK